MIEKNIFETKIEFIKGVGPKRALILNKELGVFKFSDLLDYFPYRYEDRTLFVKINKITPSLGYVNFIGRAALEKKRDKKDHKKFKMLILNHSKEGAPLLLHDEPIYLKDKIVGHTTSGCYSFNYNKNLAFGYINSGLTSDQIDKQAFEIEVEKEKYSASVITRPLNDKKLSSL